MVGLFVIEVVIEAIYNDYFIPLTIIQESDIAVVPKLNVGLQLIDPRLRLAKTAVMQYRGTTH